MKFFLIVLIVATYTSSNACVGIPISTDDFDSSVDRINNLYKSSKRLSIEDYILSVRLYNTIAVNNMIDMSSRYKTLNDSFTKEYFKKTVDKLRAKISVGLSYYSKRHDLYMGGSPHKNSFFCIN